MIPFNHPARAGRSQWLRGTVKIGVVVSLAAALATQQGCKSPEELEKERQAAAAAAKGDKRQTDADSDESPALRYGFNKGDRYTYQVQIEADLGNSTETLSGYIEYRVISADNFEIVIDQTGVLSSRTEVHPGREVSMSRMPRQLVSGFQPAGLVNRITIDREGKVLETRTHTELPYLFGNLATVVIEPLASKKPSWTEEHALEAGSKIAGGLGPRVLEQRPPNPFAPPPRAFGWDSMYVTSGTRHVEYRRSAPTDGAVKIDKHVELQCQAADAAGPVEINVTGDGYVAFNLEHGVFTKGRMTHTVTLSTGNTVTKIPLVLTYSRLSEQELAEKEKRLAAAQARRADLVGPLDAKQTEVLLEELKEPTKRLVALLRLRRSPANAQRAKVAQVLEKLLDEEVNGSVRLAALQAMEVWATKENVPTLIALADGENSSERRQAITVLAVLQDDRSVEVLAKRLGISSDRYVAAKALEAMGPVAEDHVLPYLDSEDMILRHTACRILGNIGTEKSLSKLRVIAEREAPFDAYYAKEAMTKIAARP